MRASFWLTYRLLYCYSLFWLAIRNLFARITSIVKCVGSGMREHYVCDTEVNLCYSNPCLNGGSCLRKEGGYTCLCKTGFNGNECQLDLSGKSSNSGGGSGRGRQTQQDKTCNGRTGLCAPTNCTGPANFYTPLTCQLRSRSFYRGSFLTFPALRQRYRLHVKLRYA